ncbi:T9SS type A sorting domain-containing protein [Rhodocytophaga rosea]|uniref:T9SS type A sorting domain-containing protein n=1 Tax=Rhodocytophaga rosea TaxID=2704465 RepID=A0A6C0GGF4_9BACT|nr:T9SS type A sorting domain-containing protein [Rhodocytophaga rosea]QHT66760.1 T9SS type A sorting domain-containing protein [Rhodocytophaga rosea]
MIRHLQILFFICLSYLFTPLQAQEQDTTLWVVDGQVSAAANDENNLYLGGAFKYMGQLTGGGAMLNTSDGQLVNNRSLRIKGTVSAAVSDGKGGWFIGGDFTEILGVKRNGMAHILPDNSLDMNWNLDITYRNNPYITLLFTYGNQLYIVGSFHEMGGKDRNDLAAVDLTTGEVTEWNPQVTGAVNTIIASNNLLYVGGSFVAIGGKLKNNLAALDPITGIATDWAPTIDGSVYSIVILKNTLYLAGDFEKVENTDRRRLAAIDLTNNQISSWNPWMGAYARVLLAQDNTIFVGGLFSQIAGHPRENLVALDAITGEVTPWHPKDIPDLGKNSIQLFNNQLYIGGGTRDGNIIEYLAAIDIFTGQQTEWDPGVDGWVNLVAVSENSVFVGGEFNSAGGKFRNNIAAIDTRSGRITNWNPDIKNRNGVVNSIVVSDGLVYVAGSFSTIGGKDRKGIAAIDPVTGIPTDWNPDIKMVFNSGLEVDGSVNTVALANGAVYLGGNFNRVNGAVRNNAAAVSPVTGKENAWNPNANYTVGQLIAVRDLIYIGGAFDTIAGKPRVGLAVVNSTTGQPTPWNPNLESKPYKGGCYALRLANSHLYISGNFTHIANQKRPGLAAINIFTGRVIPWEAETEYYYSGSIGIKDSIIYPVLGSYIIPVNGTTGQPATWNIKPIPLFAATATIVLDTDNFIYSQGKMESPGSTFHSSQVNAFTYHPYTKIDITEQTSNRIEGQIFEDKNKNCLLDEEDIPQKDIVVIAEPGLYYGITDSLGFYSIIVDTGAYRIRQLLPEEKSTLIKQICPSNTVSHDATFSTYGNTLKDKDFANQVTYMPYLSASIASDRRRRCFTNTTTISYCNEGSAVASDVKVHLQLPQHVVLVSANAGYTMDEDKNYVFSIGAVQAGSCGMIQIKDSVACNNPDIRGLTQCTKVWISPANPSNPSPDWDGSDITLQAKCLDNGRVKLGIYNNGSGNMADSSAYRILLDAQVIFAAKYKLTVGDSLILQVPANGQTLRLEADQSPFHPTKQQTNISIEACGVNSGGKISTGYVAQLPQDDAEPEVAIECLPIIDSYDPNDKLVSPVGVTENHYTPTNRALDYTIRFQNTGTDYAYKVVVVDTLSEYLDISTLKMGAASHGYQLNVSGKGRPVLTFTFDNILLPDSTTDQEGSNGYVKFSIKPLAGIAEKTIIENLADIFFDYNEPVRTNTVFNTIYDVPLPATNATRIGFCNTNQPPSISLLYREDLVCDLEADTYQWFLNGNPLSFSSKSIKVSQEGTYTVQVDTKGCLSPLSQGFNYTFPPPLIRSSFEIYPNPNNGAFTIYMIAPAGKTIEATLWDALGRQVWNKSFAIPQTNTIREEVILPKLRTGMYILKTTVDTPQGGTTKRIFIK